MASITDLISRATDSNTGRPVIAKLGSAKTLGAATITLSVATNWTTTSHVYIAIYTVTAAGIKDPTSQTDWKGILTGTTVNNMTLTGGTDRAYTTDAYVEITFTSRWAKDQYDWGMTHADPTGVLLPSAVQTAIGTSGIATANIADDAITAAKLQYGVVRSRQGGTTGDNSWSMPGTNNVDTSAKVVFTQVGSQTTSTSGSVTVTFPIPFTQVPLVFPATQTAIGIPHATNVTTTTFLLDNFTTANARQAVATSWLAIGQ